MKKNALQVAVLSTLSLYGTAQAADSELDISGILEVEMTPTSIAAATVEMAFIKQVNDNVSAEMTLLYEGATTDVDVAAITVAPKGSHWNLTSGQFFVPFGSFDSNMVSDPLTLELAETRAGAVAFGYETGGFGITAYIASGASSLDTNGYHIGYNYEGKGMNLGLSLGSISDLSKAGNIDSTDAVAAQSMLLTLEMGNFNVIYENIAASGAFTTGTLVGQQPTATNIELGYGFKIGDMPSTFAIGTQSSTGANGLLPQSRTMLGLSSEIMEGTSLGLEYNQETDYASAASSNITLKLAAEF